MLKLIRLELKKIKFGGYIRNAAITDIIILGMLTLIIFASISEGDRTFTSYLFEFSMVEALVKGTFIIFAAVLLSKIVIEEYKNGTITQLFMYPISRKKLIVAKLLIVSVFTFVNVIISNFFVDGALYIMNCFFRFSGDVLTPKLIVENLINITTSALSASCICLIPLFFGMRKKSVPTTIVSSVILVILICSKGDGFSLGSIVAIPVTLAVIGVVVAYFSIRNIEHVDAA